LYSWRAIPKYLYRFYGGYVNIDGGQEVLDTDDMDQIVGRKEDKDRVCPS